jgi:hypothetical protein
MTKRPKPKPKPTSRPRPKPSHGDNRALSHVDLLLGRRHRGVAAKTDGP